MNELNDLNHDQNIEQEDANNEENNRYSIFISYSRSQTKWVEFIEKELYRGDYSVYWDIQLKAGQVWWEELCKTIKFCDFFLFVVSDDSNKSTYCNAELDWATDLKKPVIPVIPEDVYLDLEQDAYGNRDVSNIIPARIQDIEAKVNLDSAYWLYEIETAICEFKLKQARGNQKKLPNLDYPEKPRLTMAEAMRYYKEVNK
ncbi:MAG: toll/interleukin-1 receptor domain-containing protein, partial [Chloroflexota bacterium]